MTNEPNKHQMAKLHELVMRARKNQQKRDEEALENNNSQFESLNEGFTSGGLQNLEQLVNIVAKYVELGGLNIEEIIARIKKDFGVDVDKAQVNNALRVVDSYKNIKGIIKDGKTSKEAVDEVYNDLVNNGVDITSKDFKRALISYGREQKLKAETKKRLKAEQEVDTTFDGNITNKTTDINLKNEVLTDPASSQILEKKIKVIKENALHCKIR